MYTLEQLSAKQEITEIIYRYCRGLDRMDQQMVLDVWHPNGTLDYDSYFVGTPEDFVTWVWEFHLTLDRHSHEITNVIIELDGDDRAVAESYFIVTLRWPTVDGEPTKVITNHGRYLDRLSRRDGRWAVDHRECIVDTGTRVELVDDPAIDGSASRATRDESDPSRRLFAGR